MKQLRKKEVYTMQYLSGTAFHETWEHSVVENSDACAGSMLIPFGINHGKYFQNLIGRQLMWHKVLGLLPTNTSLSII